MIKILHVIVMTLIALSVRGAVPKSIVIHTTEGEKALSINGIRKITFDSSADGSLRIYPKAGTSVQTYSYSNFVKGTFSEQSGVQSGIEELNLTEGVVEVAYNSAQQLIKVASPEPVNSVQVYDLRGSLVLAEYPADDNVEMSVASLQNGLYIVKAVTATGVVTKKIVKR